MRTENETATESIIRLLRGVTLDPSDADKIVDELCMVTHKWIRPNQNESRIASALESIADTMRLRYDREFPKPEPPQEAEVFHRGERAPEPATKEEYDSLPQRPGRFENLIKAARGETTR